MMKTSTKIKRKLLKIKNKISSWFSFSVTFLVYLILLIWSLPVLLHLTFDILAVFYDFKPDLILKFLPRLEALFDKLWGVPAIAGVMTFIRLSVDKDKDGTPDNITELPTLITSGVPRQIHSSVKIGMDKVRDTLSSNSQENP